VSDFRPKRERAQSIVSDAGRQREIRRPQCENAETSIFSRFELDSKATEHRLKHSEKQNLPSKQTVLGMQIEFSEEQYENEPIPISVRCDPNSNVIVESDEQREKHS
jgi:hypothetical protein